ncbi:ParB N-terminal domain-containing protein [Oscillochloris sp. ZM17-4]|uniref:methyltransferase domain-containing protein n=1 Tax=Oscillochloris sp. ZM17-4 TaxID=2866714 RepID=UPI001C73CB22|nr:ParB N-terminal domain-containing protein [Oscillochloris sp. ZM17-4]MBX0328671.1 ParB N-terminal domain-containing protein [Oscillochloris sp. ZM17-4]
MFYLDYPVANLRPALYNPRKIDDAAFADLCRSLEQLGMVKPIIVAPDQTIVAGHQRLKALMATGATTTPVYLLAEISPTDEMRFNQLHNGTDLDTGDEHVRVPVYAGLGYADVPADGVEGNLRSAGAPIRSEIAKLLIGHGPWGGIVATQSGTCLSGAQYALSCKVLGMPVRTYYIADDQAQLVRALFQRPYGQFHYGHLKRETYIQTFAQPFLCRADMAGSDSEGVTSPTYEKHVLPSLQPGEHILDFGCGQGDYVKRLTKRGLPIWGMEFFRRQGSAIDTKAVLRMADALFEHLHVHGRFDVVMCDHVINSIDSDEAEAAVLTLLNAFCNPAGKIYFSGRRRDHYERALYATSHRGGMRAFEFMDQGGLSGILLHGRWFYQKFHTKTQITELTKRYVMRDPAYQNHSASQFNLRGIKDFEHTAADVEAALRFEFNLPWPGGRTVGRAEEAVAAWRAAIAREQKPQ